jgi:hypothetical protein
MGGWSDLLAYKLCRIKSTGLRGKNGGYMDREKRLKDLDVKIGYQYKGVLRKVEETDPQAADRLRLCKYSLYYTNPRNTLKKGEIYYLGLNPGGNDKEDYEVVDSAWFKSKSIDYCAFLDEEWVYRNHRYNRGEAPPQKRVKCLLEFIQKELKTEPNEEMCFLLIYAFSDHHLQIC